MSSAETDPWGVYRGAVEQYDPVAVYACFSGGHDSLVSTHWTMTNVPGARVLHCNTGIGIEATREYVRGVCREYGWPLDEEFQEGVYEAFVLEYGFPGPPQHSIMYRRLKERSIDRAKARAKSGKPRRSAVFFVAGVHHGESLIRAGYNAAYRKVKSSIWVNPFYWQPPEAFDDYRARNSLPENPIKCKIGMSGECGCGAFAKQGELALWREADPRFGERIDDLNVECWKRGMTWGWEGGPARPEPPSREERDIARGQIFLPFMPMCHSCNKRDELTELEAAGYVVR